MKCKDSRVQEVDVFIASPMFELADVRVSLVLAPGMMTEVEHSCSDWVSHARQEPASKRALK